MKLHHRHRLAPTCLALLLPLAACAASAPVSPGTTGSAGIDGLIGEARCSVDADCRSSPIGHQACGGPAGFVAWSARQTSADALHAALQQHQAERRAQAEREGRVSTCMVMVDPGAYCRTSHTGHTGQADKPAGVAASSGRCTLRPAGSLPTR